VSTSTPVEVQSQFFSTNGEKTITSSSGQGVVLKGIVIATSDQGAYDDNRDVDFYDNTSGGPALFSYFNRVSQGGFGNYSNNSGFNSTVDIPLMGIRFPNGIKFTFDTNVASGITVFYTG
jgi:hypothetical protein